MLISSANNGYVKNLRDLSKAKAGLPFFIVEGEKLIEEISADWKIESFAVSESYAALNGCPSRARSFILKDSVFESVSAVVAPQGILAVCEKKPAQSEIDFTKSLYIICDTLSDPGNMGAVIRCARAFGCDCLLITENSADVYNPKIVRASAGALFHVPFIKGLDPQDFIEPLRKGGVSIVAAHPRGDNFINEIDFKRRTAIVIGNEANGISDYVARNCDYLAQIPMPGGTESLNAAVACGIVLYEAARQRSL